MLHRKYTGNYVQLENPGDHDILILIILTFPKYATPGLSY